MFLTLKKAIGLTAEFFYCYIEYMRLIHRKIRGRVLIALERYAKLSKMQ